MSPFVFKFAVFVLVSSMLAMYFLIPSMNLNLANSSLLELKMQVSKVIDQNRNNPDLIKDTILSLDEKLFDIVDVREDFNGDFRLINVSFKYKNLIGDNKVEKEIQEIGFIVNNV